MARPPYAARTCAGVAAILGLFAGCSLISTVEVRPSDCINPPTGDCSGAVNESRILEVRLYQLKEAIDPCLLSLDAVAAGKDLEVLKSALSDSERSDSLRWVFKVTAGEPRSIGRWEILSSTQYVLAVAVGRGKSRNSVRLIPIERWPSGWQFPLLYFKGYDICLDHPCDVNMEAQCHQ
jgi:hypothetical protein